jgi:hypothetical protein
MGRVDIDVFFVTYLDLVLVLSVGAPNGLKLKRVQATESVFMAINWR